MRPTVLTSMLLVMFLQMLSHQGATFRGRAAILGKLEEVVRQQQQCQQQQQQCQQQQQQQQQPSSLSGQPPWQLTHVDRQSLLQVSVLMSWGVSMSIFGVCFVMQCGRPSRSCL